MHPANGVSGHYVASASNPSRSNRASNTTPASSSRGHKATKTTGCGRPPSGAVVRCRKRSIESNKRCDGTQSRDSPPPLPSLIFADHNGDDNNHEPVDQRLVGSDPDGHSFMYTDNPIAVPRSSSSACVSPSARLPSHGSFNYPAPRYVNAQHREEGMFSTANRTQNNVTADTTRWIMSAGGQPNVTSRVANPSIIPRFNVAADGLAASHPTQVMGGYVHHRLGAVDHNSNSSGTVHPRVVIQGMLSNDLRNTTTPSFNELQATENSADNTAERMLNLCNNVRNNCSITSAGVSTISNTTTAVTADEAITDESPAPVHELTNSVISNDIINQRICSSASFSNLNNNNTTSTVISPEGVNTVSTRSTDSNTRSRIRYLSSFSVNNNNNSRADIAAASNAILINSKKQNNVLNRIQQLCRYQEEQLSTYRQHQQTSINTPPHPGNNGNDPPPVAPQVRSSSGHVASAISNFESSVASLRNGPPNTVAANARPTRVGLAKTPALNSSSGIPAKFQNVAVPNSAPSPPSPVHTRLSSSKCTPVVPTNTSSSGSSSSTIAHPLRSPRSPSARAPPLRSPRSPSTRAPHLPSPPAHPPAQYEPLPSSDSSSLNDFLDDVGNQTACSAGGAIELSGSEHQPQPPPNTVSASLTHPITLSSPVEQQATTSQQHPPAQDGVDWSSVNHEDSTTASTADKLSQHIQQQILQHQRHVSQQRNLQQSFSRCERVNNSSSGGRSSRCTPFTLTPLHHTPALDNPTEVANFILALRRERSRLLQEIECEESERSHYTSQLETLTQRYNLLTTAGQHQSAECRRLEGDIRRLREVGTHRLGSPGSANRRRHHRLHAINTIEKTIQRLHHLPNEGPRNWTTSGADGSRQPPSLPRAFDPRVPLPDTFPRPGKGSTATRSPTGTSTAEQTRQPQTFQSNKRLAAPSSSGIAIPQAAHSSQGASGTYGETLVRPSSTASSNSNATSPLGAWYEHLPPPPPHQQQHHPHPPTNVKIPSEHELIAISAVRMANPGQLLQEALDSSSSTLIGGGSSLHHPHSNGDHVNGDGPLDSSLDSGVQQPPPHEEEAQDGSLTDHNGYSGGSYDDDGSYNSNGPSDVPRLPSAIEAVLRGVWPFEKALWHSSPASMGATQNNSTQADPPGIMATSSVTGRRAQSQQQLLSNKMEMVYGLLSMFSSGDRADISKTLLAMSSSADSCLALRQSGCLPLLIQLLHGGCDDSDLPSREARLRASQALHNVVHANTDEKRGRREARVLRLLEQIRAYSDYLFERLERTSAGQGPLLEDDMDRHPCPAMAALMKLSFDEEHRLAMCSLGGLHAIAELIKRDHEAHGPTTPDNFCITLRRYAGMALTNLTFGAGNNKTLVCSFSGFLRALVAQLNSPSQDLRQVTSSVIRNLSWRADSTSKQALREAGAVAGLMRAALTATKEATLKVILSAVWNLSAHCSVNKAEICAVEGALAFICNSLTYKSQSRTLAIVENAGGILRNISSHIAVREDLRQVLRDHNTLSVILSQLRSPSLTVVSNACGTLWNLSARCAQDQQTLWDLGAVPMLRSLINSKHKMISMGSSAALKNLLQAKPEGVNLADSKHGLGLPSLQARRQKALEQELDPSLAETCDNIESSPRASPTTVGPDSPFFGGVGVNDGNNVLFNQQMFQSLDPRYGGLMTESRDSIVSNHSSRSDNTHDRAALQHLLSRRTPQQPPCPPGSSNGHRPADLALRNMGHHPTGTDGETSGSSSEHLFGDKSNSAPNTARSGLHPSDPLYNMYSKYVVKNGKKVSASSSGKHPKSEDGKSSLKDKPPVKVNNYVRESSEEVDNVDQPTDFSLRYSETVDDEEVNGSSSQQKPVRRVKPNASHNHEEEFLGADDSVQTYFTEGTPLNFSTATSLSDLRESVGTGVGSSAKLGTQEEEDENLEGASEEDKNGHEEEEDNEEGNLSRFSSMSSISSGEISAGHEHELEEDSDLQELVLAEGERVAAAAAKAAKDSLSPQHTAATNGEERLQQKQDNEQNWSSQATPLMFSRTTSLGSLSSFPQHQPLDDNGSVVSEFSRVASGAVSPSDLPDSPSQTMPSSPRPHKQQQQPHPAAPGARGASSSSQRSGGSNHGVFSDVPHTFNEEGTPCHLSRGTSLSSLTIDDACSSARGSNGSTQPPLTTDRVRGDGKDSSTNTPSPRSSQGAGRGRSIPTPRTSSIPRPQSFAAQDHERSRSSDPHAAAAGGGAGRGAAHRGRTKEKRPSNISDGDGEKLLAACISSGMPTNRRPSDAPKTPGTASRSSSFIKSPRTPTLGAPVIPPPPPPPPPPRLCGDESGIRGRVSNIPINTVNLQVTTTTLNLAQGVIGDSVRTYCTEDTPANISHAGSVSDLTGDQQSRPRSALKKPSHTPMLQDSADSSDAEGILDRCIQAAMPKMRAIKGKPPSPRHTPSRAAAGKPPAVVASPTSALPRKAGSGTSSPRRAVPVARVSPAIKQCPPPEVISHPSKLSIHKPSSNFNGEEVKNWGEVEGTPLGFSNATSLSDLTVDSSCKGDSGIPRPDAPKRYATEDTPADISRCESLSSLSCDEEGGQITSRLADGGKGQRGAVSRSADSRKRTSMGTGKGDEVPKTFTVEDTPAALSRRSSLSSIDGLESSKQSSMIHTPGEVDKGATSCQVTPGDASAPRNFGVEGTPVNFSRNSSLSSLSVESYPEETTPSEQALLQHCINQGMPKGDRTSRGATPSRGGKKSKTGSRIPGLSHSPGRSPARSPATNIPSVAMSRLQLVNIDTEQRPDHESTKLRSDFEQSEKKQQKSPRVPEEARVRQQSIEDITEVTEPISDTSTLPIAEAARKVSANGSSSSPEDKDKQSSNGGSGGERGGGFSDVSMTDSMIVATEALRVARAVQEGRSSDDASIMSQSITSENLLENIPVPAAMEACVSMSASLTDEIKTPQMQRKAVLECRHTRKGIPAMVRRALGDQERDGNGSASMASSCHSNLDNVVPPSFMEADDMESSMISVASITSEVAESRHSPPSLTSSIPSEAMAAIEGPAQQIARMLQREARQLPSSATMTLTAGEETSTYHEITELDRDDTLGFHDATATDTYHSADDIPPDIPDLPQDSPVHRPGARSSPQVTPSMLRKAVQNSSDKYRTFTKSERRAAVQATGGSSNIGDSSRLLSTQQTDRYRARAMSVEGDDDGDMSPVTPTADNPTGSPLQRRSLKEKRNNNPDRYRTRTIESGTPVSPRRPGAKGGEDGLIEFRDGAELDLTAEQLEALSQDANIVICTLNENREANTADLLHGLSQENILDIETLSLISSDEEDNNTYDVEAPRSPAVPGRPRIVKPGEQQPPVEVQEDDDGAGKGIRGRRKGLYPGARKPQTAAKPAQSPVTRPVPTPATAFKPTPRSQQPATQLQTPGSPKAPRATRASELRSKAGRVGSSSSSSPASSAGSSPRMGANARTITTTARTPPQVHSTQPGPGLRRQNTFTKDDLEDGSSSPTPKASAAPSTKPRYRKDTVQPAAGVASRQMSKGSPEQTRSGQSSKSYSLTRDVKPPSASDMADWSKETKSGKTSKKDVTSRIANLWKRVEKAQASSKPKENDSRVWITKASKEKTPTDGQSSPPQLVRSSTYEKLCVNGESRSDTDSSGSKNKTRLGLKLSRLRGRDTKSSPPSEAGTPVTPNGTATHLRRGISDTATTPDGATVKRLSRLGSFVVVDGEEDLDAGSSSTAGGSTKSPQSAVVAPFHYQPPGGASASGPFRSRSNSHSKAAVAGDNTRIPMPSKVIMSNNPRDDNGNAPYV